LEYWSDGEKNRPCDCTRAVKNRKLAMRTTTACFAFRKVCGNRKTRAIRRFNKIYFYRLHLVEKLLVHEIGDSVIAQDFVIILRLIQSHAQRGP
jgi:hypothetical protein